MGETLYIIPPLNEQAIHIPTLVASALGIQVVQASVCIDLLDSGATIPFIARYRKEATGALDDAVIFTLAGHLDRVRKLEERRTVVLTKISESGNLSPDLADKIRAAGTLAELDDLYLPYKPRRRTRADKAREQGLQPLADLITSGNYEIDPLKEAARFINPELDVPSANAALCGAEDIIAGQMSENPDMRNLVRQIFFRSSHIRASAARGTGGETGKYKEYVGISVPVHNIPSHRILALFRGEEEGFLSVKIGPDDKEVIRLLTSRYVTGTGPVAECIADAVADGYHRLISPSIEREQRNDLKMRADEEAARVFATNLRALLLTPPLGAVRILAIDPGFRTGCKVVALNEVGDFLTSAIVFPHEPRPDPTGAGKVIREICSQHRVQVIAVGDGTAGRETWQFIRSLGLSPDIIVVSVPEQGASVYSASELARIELPDMDVTMRGAVSIGRRLLDPLAEMVKIEPRSLGIGQYQHDIDQTMLKQYLEEVVRSVVNEVGVDLNSASPSLLSYVSGLNFRIAAAIVDHRERYGPFMSREEIRAVKGIGDKIYEQSAGFLRIRDGKNPLDNTGVHPERYLLVADLAASINAKIDDIIGIEDLVRQIRLNSFITEECGLPTLTDIAQELIKPGRDPRGQFEPPVYADMVTSFDDLEEGMELDGVITNVTNFGAFVNIGIKESGLIHVSEMADRFIHDPAEVVSIHQRVRVKVISIDSGQRRIALSIKQVAGL